MMNILLAEDDRKLGRLLQHLLENEQIKTDLVTTGDVIVDQALSQVYDVLVLDWMLPMVTGITACQILRKQGYQGSILLLTARDAVDDRVAGLDAGADDYLVKPFETAELLARIRALARRGTLPLMTEMFQLGDLILDRTNRTAIRAGRHIQLTGREFQLLDLLMQNNGQALTRELLIDRIWGLETEVTPNNLDAFVRLLRKKIDHPGETELIKNIRGIGYKLVVTHV
ncbi:MAG: two component transcriptional regulator, winged helix family [Firmicutes bacterium]|nr:two component transcriptional regulator, winged helix family [Bacillota bacterium]